VVDTNTVRDLLLNRNRPLIALAALTAALVQHYRAVIARSAAMELAS